MTRVFTNVAYTLAEALGQATTHARARTWLAKRVLPEDAAVASARHAYEEAMNFTSLRVPSHDDNDDDDNEDDAPFYVYIMGRVYAPRSGTHDRRIHACTRASCVSCTLSSKRCVYSPRPIAIVAKICEISRRERFTMQLSLRSLGS